MFVKLQLDPGCLSLLGSTKIVPNIGISVSPLEKLEAISKDRKQRVIKTPDAEGFKKKFIEFPRPSRDTASSGRREFKKQSLVENPGTERRANCWDSGGVLKENEGNGKFRRSSTRQDVVVKKVHTKCSTKWGSYGGCIPAILQALVEVKDLDKALQPWEGNLNNKERSIILKEQVSWERALEIFDWFKNKGCYELNVIHYNIMLRKLGKARKWSYIEGLWDEMKAKGIAPINSTYGTLIDVYSKGGLKEKALLWLARMNKQGMVPDEVTMGIVVQLYKKAGEFQKAEGFFKKWSLGEQLRQKSKTLNGSTKMETGLLSHVCLSSHTYNTLIDTYGKAGQLKEASKVFAEMLTEGIAPTTVTFNTMIHICGNHGQIEEVTSLIQKMEELRCPPDTRTYNILISFHVKRDDINMATKYFKKMKEAYLEPDPVTYRTLLYAYSIRHMVSEAEDLVSEMDHRGLEIDEFTQSALTRMFIESENLEKSWLWFKRFHLTGRMSSECYSANIDAYGEHGLVSEAENVFYSCQEAKKLTVRDFNVMIKAYGVGKCYQKACLLFDSMENHDVVPDKCTYSSLIQILAGAGMPHEANSYLMKMQNSGLVSDCVLYCAVISSFIKLGKLKMAEELYKEMVRYGVKPDVLVFGILMNAFADAGCVKEALGYVDEMKKSGLPLNTVIYNSLIKLFTKVGFLKEAQDTYELLSSEEEGPATYSSNCMIDLYTSQSMVEPAEEIFERLKRKGAANEFTFAMMLCLYKKLGRFDEAFVIAKQMKELGILTELLSYNHVLGLYAVCGRYKEVLVTFTEMMKASVQPDDSTFESLGIVLVRSGVSRQAVGKLGVMTKKNAQVGLQKWVSALSSVVLVDDCDYL
ncbi:hypothetical protein CsatB_026320 [Cannabis sativa]